MVADRSGALRATRSEAPEWLRGLALAWLVVALPVLTFPEFLWPTWRWPVAGLAALSCALSGRLLGDAGRARWYATIFAIAVTIGWLRAADQKTALSHFGGVAAGLLVTTVVWTWCRTQGRLAFAVALFVLLGLTALVLGGLSASIPAPTKYLTAEYLPQVPLGLPNLEKGGLVNPNALSVTALMVFPLAAVLACLTPASMRGRRALMIVAGATCACAFVVIVVMQSRSTWVAAWLTAMIAVSGWKRLGRKRLAALAVLVVVPLCVVLWVRAHLDPTVATAAERMQGRITIWKEGLAQLRASPLVGVGLNAFRQSPMVGPDIPHAHNIFLQTALDSGIVGLSSYLAFFASVLAHARRARAARTRFVRGVAAAAALSIIGVHLFGLADAVALGAKVGVFQWWAAGLALAASQIQDT